MLNHFSSFLIEFPDQCTTPIYQRSEGNCACGFFLQKGLTWNVANHTCHAEGARLPEVYSAADNDAIQALRVILEAYNLG